MSDGQIVTKELIQSLKTPRGGYTRQVLELFDISWPPPKGWTKGVIGKPLSGESLLKLESMGIFQRENSNKPTPPKKGSKCAGKDEKRAASKKSAKRAKTKKNPKSDSRWSENTLTKYFNEPPGLDPEWTGD